MLESGDTWVPRLDGRIYLDKPPLSFWVIAASRACFGPGEFAIRLPGALAHVATTALVMALGLAMCGRRIGLLAGFFFASALAPFVAANVVTPDGLLTLWVTLAGWATWRAVITERIGWWLLAGSAAGLGLLTKGAAMLVFAAAFAVGATLASRGVRWLARPGPWLGLILALLIGLPWFISIARLLPGAADYFLVNQVSGRLFDDRYDRNSQWYRSVTLYVPMLIIGLLPWSVVVPIQRWREWRNRSKRSAVDLAPIAGLFLAAWVVLPFLVFAAARSRLPLYVLPLFAPIAVVLASKVPRVDPERVGGAGRLAFTVWILVLAGIKLAAAWVPSRRDAARTAAFVTAELAAFPSELWVVDTDLWALPLYGAPEPRRATSSLYVYPMYEPLPPLGEALRAARPGSLLVVTTSNRREQVASNVREALDLECEPSGQLDRLVTLRCGPPLEMATLDNDPFDSPRRLAKLNEGFDAISGAPGVAPR